MKVHELITKLQAMPQDAIVIYRRCSTYTTLEGDEPRIITAESKTIAFYNGEYMEVPERWIPKGETVKYVTAVTFPGN